jgi:hypothetical protein
MQRRAFIRDVVVGAGGTMLGVAACDGESGEPGGSGGRDGATTGGATNGGTTTGGTTTGGTTTGGTTTGGPMPEVFDFYISPSGSDSNDGLTPSTAWAITALNTKRETYAGHRVGLLDGTYPTGGIAPYAGGDSPSLGVAPGSPGNPTVIEALNHRAAILDHDGGGIACIGAYDATAGHFTLRGLKIINARDFSVYINRTRGRGEGVVVDSCELTEQQSDSQDITAGVFLQALDAAQVVNCHFHDITNTTGGLRVSAILQYGTIGTVVDRCTFDGTYGGVHSKYAGGTPRTDDQETHVKQCYFHQVTVACRGFDNKDQTGPGPSNPPYGPFIIENNVFENCDHALGNDGPFSAGSPVIVRNNTIYATSAGAKDGFNLHTWQPGCEPSFYNNIWYLGGSASLVELCALAISVDGSGTAYADVIDYNCYGPSSMQWVTQTGYGYPYSGGGYTTHTSSAAWQGATGGDDTTHSLFATDPSFTMAGSGAARFQLAGGSPCIGAGRAGGSSGGAAMDMGAWAGVTQVGCDFA